MPVLTTLARMWLTRSLRPFTFRRAYDRTLDFAGLDGLGLYIHIPFCKSICPFCPYCKELYDRARLDAYVDRLIREIDLVGGSRPGKTRVTSLYFGGGTPALAAHRLPEIMDAVQRHFTVTEGVGLELHPENVTVETLSALRRAGVTKISIGVQSFQTKFLRLLGRRSANFSGMFDALARVPFETVSMDFIFALPGQTAADLKADIETAFAHGANHIAMYPFIDFSFTDSTLPAMEKRAKRALLDEITLYCEGKGYARDSIWTFSKTPHARYSSMTRDNFLGFGCSATTLLRGQFKINTFSVAEYEKRIDSSLPATALTLRFTRRQRMVYYLFWTAYSTRVDERDFERFFGVPLRRMYGVELWLAERLGFATKRGSVHEMTRKGAFYYHYYENFYTLAYIDKMWRVMRLEAFPKELKL